MFSLKIRYALYGVIASASLITLVAQASPTDGVFGDYFRRMITTACTGTGVVTGFDDTIGSAAYGMKTCTALSTILGNYQIHPVGGNVGIGTTSPSAKLEVTGSVKIKDGTQGLGKVLTSDEDGFASWKMPSGGGGLGSTLSLPCVPGGTGIYNICHGSNALIVNTTGQSNAALGNNALMRNSIGYYNVAVGNAALTSNIIGGQNTAVGIGALYNNSSGNDNTAIGLYSLMNIVSGDYNTALGRSAGENLISGTNNIAIGYGTRFADDRGSNQINIGNIIFGMGLVGTVDTPAGNVGIGVKYPRVKLDIDGAVRLANVSFDCNSSYKGVIRYNTYIDTFEGCNGTNWMAFNSNVALYTWQLEDYGKCSVECGGPGTHTAQVNCKNDSGMNVVDSYCAGDRPKAVTRACNNGPCRNCISPDPSCSGAGWCTLTNNPSKENEAWVMGGSNCGFKCNADREGSNCEKKKITETYSWSIGEYSVECSKKCDGGTKTRTVVCKDSSGNTMADDTKCGTKPDTSMSCNTQACEKACATPNSCGSPGSCYAPSGCDNACGSTKANDCAGTCGGTATDYNGSTAGCGYQTAVCGELDRYKWMPCIGGTMTAYSSYYGQTYTNEEAFISHGSDHCKNATSGKNVIINWRCDPPGTWWIDGNNHHPGIVWCGPTTLLCNE